MTDTLGMFDDPPPAPDPLDAIAARQAQTERDRNARRRGTRTSHPCPACGARTFRRPRVFPSAGTVDARCVGCVNANLWPEQHVDRRGLNTGLDDRPRCAAHPTQLAGACPLCTIESDATP